MIKNAILFRISGAIDLSPVLVTSALEAHSFAPCGASQQESIGWVPPRGHENGPLLEVIAGQWILKLTVESKRVPSELVGRLVSEKIAEIEISTGRKPGKKETRELKEDAFLTLLPSAFPTRSAMLVWIDPASRLLVVAASSAGKADLAVTALIRAIEGFSLQHFHTQCSPAGSMAAWLTAQEAPEHFTLDRECELKACDESKAVVKYGRHALDIEEIRQHITAGKVPTKLALTYNDRVSFVLTDSLALKKIAFLDVVFEETRSASDGMSDAFDADVAIMTGEMSKLVPALLNALGGEVVEEGGAE